MSRIISGKSVDASDSIEVGKDKYGNVVYQDDDGYFTFYDGRNGSGKEYLDDYDPNDVYHASDYSIYDYLQFNGNAWGSLYDDLIGLGKQKEELKNQELLMDKQHEMDIDIQQRQMDFESEVSKVDRMKEAGMNPLMMAGSSSGSVSAPSTPAPNASSHFDPLSAVRGLASSGIDLVSMLAHNRNLDSETLKNNVEAGLIPLTASAQIELWRSEASKFASEVGLNDANRDFIIEQRDFYKYTSESRAEEIRQNVRNLKATYQKIWAEERNINRQTEVLDATEANIKAQTNLYNKQAYAAEKQGDYDAEARELLVQEYEAVQDFFNGIPLSVQGRERIAALYKSSDPKDHEEADKILDALDACATRQYETEVRNATEHRWENFGNDFFGSVADLPSSFSFFIPFGSGRGRSRRGRR